MSVHARLEIKHLLLTCALLSLLPLVPDTFAADSNSPSNPVSGGTTGSNAIIGDGTSLLFKEGNILREFELKKDEVYAINLSGDYQFTPIPVLPTAQATVAYVDQINNENPDLQAKLVLMRKGLESTPANRRIITGYIKVQLKEGDDTLENAVNLAAAYGVSLEMEEVFGGWILLRADSSINAIAKAAEISQNEMVIEAGPKLLIQREIRKCDQSDRVLELNDPLFSQQWYYNENVAGQTVAVMPVWINRDPLGNPFLARSYTGDHIRIGIADDGLEIDHEDLDRNTPPGLHFDFLENDKDPTSTESHGTKVGGLAAARGGNGIGMIGAAPEADLIGIRFLGGTVPDSKAFNHNSGSIDILNNSWGPPDPYQIQDPDDLRVLKTNVELRDRIFTFAVANAFQDDYWESYDGYTNNRFTIGVGAVNWAGGKASYSSIGPGLFVCGVASDDDLGLPPILTTTLFDQYTTAGLDGTSFACPMVSGIAALMLEARPDLGWRDVQWILRETANGRDPLIALLPPFHNYFTGWGIAHGAMAVKTAEIWPLVPRAFEATEVQAGSRITRQGKEYFFDMKGAQNTNLIVEHVELDVKWLKDSPDMPVRIELLSPAFPYNPGDALSPGDFLSDYTYDQPEEWTFMKLKHWGENSSRGSMNGVWRVRIYADDDTPADNGRRLTRLTLRIYGIENNSPPVVTSADVTIPSQPGALNPRVAEDNEDVTVSNVVIQDNDLDPVDIAYNWQVQQDEEGDFVNIPGLSGAISGICQYPGIRADFEMSAYPARYDRSFRLTDISDAGCNDIVSWLWDFGDGTTSTLQNPTHTYTSPTNNPAAFPVTLTVTNSIGGVATFTKGTIVFDIDALIPGNLPPLLYNDQPQDIDNFLAETFVLPASETTPGYSYRLQIIPSDANRAGQIYQSAPIFILATPPGIAVHGEEYVFPAKLPIFLTPPYDLPPYILVSEFSQGTLPHPANGEWVEFLTTVDLDMRDYSVSNNLITFDAVFRSFEYWRKVPAGTIIVVYNQEFRDPILPPDDFDYTDGTLVLPAGGEFFDLPTNGDGWGEFPNYTPAYVAVLNKFCAPVHGVSFNSDNKFVQLNEDIHGSQAEHIAQNESAFVDIGTLGAGGDWSYNDQASWVVTDGVSATPGLINSAANAGVLTEIANLDPINGGPVNTVPEYSYSPAIPGITINPETGVMSGFVDMPEGGQFTITVTRQLSWDSISQTFVLTIAPAGDGTDTDHDGVTALMERALGMNNSVADAHLLPYSAVFDAGGGDKFLLFSYRRLSGGFPDPGNGNAYTWINDDLGNIRYEVWTTTDLKNWTNATAAGILVEANAPVQAADNPLVEEMTVGINSLLSGLGEQFFYQLRVTRIPPAP